MTTRTFRPYEPDDLWLLPPSPQEWLPADHLAYFVSDLVEELDLRPILRAYGGVTRGTAPYHPRLLVKVLLYAYAIGVAASRQMARELEEDVAFRVLAANQQPDFRTISDVRQQHLAARTGLFGQVLKRCQRAGLVALGHIALDGTTLQTNVSKHKAMSYDRMVKEETRLQAEVDALLHAADVAMNGPWHWPGGSSGSRRFGPPRRSWKRRRTREAALKQATLDARPATRPRRCRPPEPPSSVPHPKAQRNFTDSESRIMPVSGAKGSVVQGYTCQAAVDARAQIIVAADVTDESNDKQHAQPLLTQVLVNTEQVPRAASLDAGYFSEANVMVIAAWGCIRLISPDRQLHGPAVPAAPRGRPPAGLSVADRMRRTLRPKPGRWLYARRKAVVEPVFGQIKQGEASTNFCCAGCARSGGNGRRIGTTHHVLKLWRVLRHRCPRHGRCGRAGSSKTERRAKK